MCTLVLKRCIFNAHHQSLNFNREVEKHSKSKGQDLFKCVKIFLQLLKEKIAHRPDTSAIVSLWIMVACRAHGVHCTPPRIPILLCMTTFLCLIMGNISECSVHMSLEFCHQSLNFPLQTPHCSSLNKWLNSVHTQILCPSLICAKKTYANLVLG